MTWEWKIGDPVDDANGGTMDAQNWIGDHYVEKDDNGGTADDSKYWSRKAKEYSMNGNHLQAIECYKEAGPHYYSEIAGEYEAMQDYDNALYYFNKACDYCESKFSLVDKADFLYRIGRYDEAIVYYEKILKILDNDDFSSEREYVRVYDSIVETYRAWGKYDLASRYQSKSKDKTDDYVKKMMKIADEHFNKGNCRYARDFYKKVLEHDFNNAKAKTQIEACERVLSMSREEQDKFRKEAQERLKREEELKIINEEREKREQERIAREKRMKEIKERERKRKEECEKNPECVKKEIKHFKKKVLKDYYLFLHFEYYQEKSDIKFKEILEYEELLEKIGVEENYSLEDFKVLKKENKRIKYILNHVDGKYRGNAIKLFVKNQKKIDMLEKRYPEKGFFENLINEVWGSDSEDIQSLEVEISARDKIDNAKNLTLDYSYETVNLQEAMDLLNQARAEISEYLKYKKANQYYNLRNLTNDIGDLEEEINNKLYKIISFRKKRLFLINRDKYSNNQFTGKPGMDLKLVKEDSGDIITVYYEDKPIGTVSNNFSSDFEKIFSDNSQLKYLPKTSSAKYFYRYGKFDIFEINMSRIKIDARLKQEKILKKYHKNELIAVVDIEHEDMEFEEGMKFKLIKESDYRITGKIGVYLDDEKIGSVSNGCLTYNLTTKASDLKNIPDESYAEYLLKYEYKYPIARIIKKKNINRRKKYSSETSLNDGLEEKIAYVKKSSYRTKVIKSLDGEVKTPSQIAKDAGIVQNNVYNTLKQLKEHELIECINPEVRKGKLYRLTENGEKIVKKLDK